MDWSGAYCKGNVDLFFDENPARVDIAKQICSECPLGRDCLLFALENQELYGVWGGKTYFERKIIAIDLGMDPLPERDSIDHGTIRGYDQHKAHGIPIDEGDPCGCLEAYRAGARERMRAYRKRKKLRAGE
jgi:hypothetical protein